MAVAAETGEQTAQTGWGDRVVDKWLGDQVIVDEFWQALVKRVEKAVGENGDGRLQAQLWLRRKELETEIGETTERRRVVGQELKGVQLKRKDSEDLKDPKHRFDLPKMRREYDLYEAAALWVYVATGAVLGRGMELLPPRGLEKRGKELEQQKSRLEVEQQEWDRKVKTLVGALGQASEFNQWLWLEIEQVAVQKQAWAEVYGLKLADPSRLPGFLDEYSRRVRGEPEVGEIREHLRWVVEEAYKQEIEADLLQALPVTEDLALDLVASYTEGDEAFELQLQQVAEEISGHWDLRENGVSGWRDNCIRFCRRRLVEVWEQAGVYERRSNLPLDLPIVTEERGEVGGQKLENGEGGREEVRFAVVVRLPNGVEVTGAKMRQGVDAEFFGLDVKAYGGQHELIAKNIAGWVGRLERGGTETFSTDKINPDAARRLGYEYRFDATQYWKVGWRIVESEPGRLTVEIVDIFPHENVDKAGARGRW